MKKPIIGVVPLFDKEKDSLWMLPGYMKGVELAQGIPVMLPLTTNKTVLSQLLDTVDGVLFAGGQDVYPQLYHESPIAECGEPCLERDVMETKLLQLILERDMPMLGICRGIQSVNAILGGTLYQDLPTELPSSVCHKQKPPYDIPAHKVSLKFGSPLHSLLQKDVIEVNSYHHQAIKTLAPSLDVMACSEDGLIEAVCAKGYSFIWAVQWHPEFSYQVDAASRKLFEALVQASAR